MNEKDTKRCVKKWHELYNRTCTEFTEDISAFAEWAAREFPMEPQPDYSDRAREAAELFELCEELNGVAEDRVFTLRLNPSGEYHSKVCMNGPRDIPWMSTNWQASEETRDYLRGAIGKWKIPTAEEALEHCNGIIDGSRTAGSCIKIDYEALVSVRKFIESQIKGDSE